MEIKNKTKKPLRVPLPGGKKLFLGPGKTGQITPKSADHPPLVKLIEEEQLEILDTSRSKGTGTAGGSGISSSQSSGGAGGVRHTGDR